jgi:hypothetical protein
MVIASRALGGNLSSARGAISTFDQVDCFAYARNDSISVFTQQLGGQCI